MPYPLEFGVATADGPSSCVVAVSQVCIRGGGPSCCGWVLMGVSPVRPRVVGSSPSLACQFPVLLFSSFQLLPPPWGDIWQHTSYPSWPAGRAGLCLR